jgi:pyruvate dehydrogenase E2 component (dihydrolipoamide acetyltransferase)
VATEVELPQLGESVTEGIITAWLVEVGDEVEVDQPLVEISTDKVDTEIPSPVAGTVQELKAEVDDTIEVGQVIAVVGEGAAAGGDEGGSDEGGAEDTGGGSMRPGPRVPASSTTRPAPVGRRPRRSPPPPATPRRRPIARGPARSSGARGTTTTSSSSAVGPAGTRPRCVRRSSGSRSP